MTLDFRPPSQFSRRDLLRFAALAVPVGRALAWQKDATFATGVSVVNVLATVHDKQGKIVHDLTKEDFTILEDGKQQKIQYFSQQGDLPLLLGLLVDASGSQRAVLGKERDASREFLEKVLREDKDKAFVLKFDSEVELLQDFTFTRKELESALKELQNGRGPQMNRQGTGNPFQGGGQFPGGGGGNGKQRGGGGGFGVIGTLMYDAIYLASNDLYKPQEGRKAAILITDGVDMNSKETVTDAIEAAQRADTLVYSIYFKGEYGQGFGAVAMPGGGGMGGGMGRRGGGGMPPTFPGGGGGGFESKDGKKILQRISRETGGGYYEVSNKQPLEKIYKTIEEELRNQYSLGYTPAAGGGGYRKLAVSVKKKGLTVRTRDGYYAN